MHATSFFTKGNDLITINFIFIKLNIRISDFKPNDIAKSPPSPGILT